MEYNDLKEIENEELKARIEHREAIIAIQDILATDSGKRFIRYLFKSFDVCELPPIGLTGEILNDRLGFLRAGNSIFKIISEANPEIAGAILAQIQKDNYDWAEIRANAEQRRTTI